MKIILASESIDRRELFKRLEIPFQTLKTNIDEEKFQSEIDDPIELVMLLAEIKANTAKDLLKKKNQKKTILLSLRILLYDFKDRSSVKLRIKTKHFPY